jgi:hypothetical protein
LPGLCSLAGDAKAIIIKYNGRNRHKRIISIIETLLNPRLWLLQGVEASRYAKIDDGAVRDRHRQLENAVVLQEDVAAEGTGVVCGGSVLFYASCQ